MSNPFRKFLDRFRPTTESSGACIGVPQVSILRPGILRSRKLLFVLGALLLPATLLAAQTKTLRIAAAADLQPVLPTFVHNFEQSSGTKVEVSYASSATLATQILNGAPSAIKQKKLTSSVSGRNQLVGKVVQVRFDGLLAQVKLAIGDQIVTAVITADAARELQLRPGIKAAALIKATEVMVVRV